MSDGLDNLTRTKDNSEISLQHSKKFTYTKRKIQSICRAFTLEFADYKPKKTVDNLESYLKSSNKLERILYSEISNYIFSLDMSKRGVLATNVEKLLLYSLDDENNINDDCKKLIIKIYDHCQLVIHQIENVNNIFAEGIDETKLTLQKDIKGIEREYITILGIFASIILTFVGGITFSTSVLQNISGVSIFRLLFVIDLLAFILINVIYILVKFIFIINDKESALLNVKIMNIFCLVFAVLLIAGWLLNFNTLSKFIVSVLPWTI